MGPKMAGAIRHPILADVAYVSLKPLEWALRATMKDFVPDAFQRVPRVYTYVKPQTNLFQFAIELLPTKLRGLLIELST